MTIGRAPISLGQRSTPPSAAPINVALRGRPSIWRALASDPAALVAAGILAGMVLMATLGPLLVGDPTAQELERRLRPPTSLPDFPLGTDHLGRDVLSRTVNGGRISLLVAFASVGLASVVGLIAGLVSGYYRGILDDVLMRLVDIQLSIPFLMQAMTIVALVGPSLQLVVFVLLLHGWVIYARLVRGETLSLREREFVLASRCVGASSTRTMLRHIVPNLISPLIVLSTLELANMIIIEASLSFLGLGIPPPNSSWGGMLSDGRERLTVGVWWVALVPAAAITLTILSVNILGDWLRDWFDPRLAYKRGR